MEKDLDKKLYNDYLNGEKEAFEFLYSKYKGKIEYFIYNIIKDYQKAEDLTQETFIYIMQNKIEKNTSFKYHIYLVARSKALNYIKTENKRNEIAEKYLLNKDERTEKDIFEIISKEETKKELLESIEQLDEKYKNAIYLTNIEGLSYEETSKILGKTLPNTKKLVYRGKKQLRKILIKKGFDEMNKVAKVLIIMIIATTFIGGIVYAINNIKISGRPVVEWFNVNFSEEYENYREEVQDEIIQAPSESSIELVSTVCDEGLVILEFNVKLSEQDKKYLKIGEPILPEEYINATDDEDSQTIDTYDVDYENRVLIPKKTRKEANIEEFSGKIIEDKIKVGYNNIEEENIPRKTTSGFAIIDGEYKVIRFKPQTIEQISEYEYKVYQMYFLTDKELGDKTEFTLTLKDFVITTAQRQIHDKDTFLEIDGQFDIELSKEKALENSKKIEVSCDEVIYEDKDLTQKIESVVVTPLQTIVKVHSICENVSNNNCDELRFKKYKVMNDKGEEINSHNFETRRMMTFADGKEEKWDVGKVDPERPTFTNATLEMIDYILIEKHDDDSQIKIISQEGKEYTDIGSFEIDLTKEIE